MKKAKSPKNLDKDSQKWLEDFKDECKKRKLDPLEARDRVLKALGQIPDSSRFAFTPSEALDLLKPH
jgi:hypothetical protein